MSIRSALALILMGFTLSTVVCAEEEDTVNAFTIGDPAKPTITPSQLARGREVAVANAREMVRNPQDIIVGNPQGSTSFIQFVDFMCTLSKKMDGDIMQMIKANPDLRVVYKSYPIRGSVSVFAGRAAMAADKQGKYLPFHVALMKESGFLTNARVLEIAKEQGLDVERLKKDMEDKAISEEIQSTARLADKIGVPGTPVLFFAKTHLVPSSNPDSVLYMLGEFTQPELQKAVDKINSEE
jgi:protein-disulfide isomerase